MELYISDHPLDCLTCAANGDCELQDMAGAVGLRDVRYGYEGDNHLKLGKDETNPYFTFDASKCIVCRSEEHTSELQSLMRISYAVFCLKKKNIHQTHETTKTTHTHKNQ